MNKPWVEHVALRVKNPEWYLTFFQDVLGMKVTALQGEEANPRQIWIGGFQLTRDEEYAPRPHTDERAWHIGVNVDNPDEALAKALSYPEVKPFADGPDQKHWFTLPDGLVIELVNK